MLVGLHEDPERRVEEPAVHVHDAHVVQGTVLASRGRSGGEKFDARRARRRLQSAIQGGELPKFDSCAT